MPTEQQPEEAATRLPAAAASAAGSFAQTQMYGRGLRQRPNTTREKPAAARQKPETRSPSPRPAAPEPGHEVGQASASPSSERAAPADTDEALEARPQARNDDMDPTLEDGVPLAGGQAAPSAAAPDSTDAAGQTLTTETGSQAGAVPGEPGVSSEMLTACSEQDAAAARARLAQGQQLELPPVPPAPGWAPGL